MHQLNNLNDMCLLQKIYNTHYLDFICYINHYFRNLDHIITALNLFIYIFFLILLIYILTLSHIKPTLFLFLCFFYIFLNIYLITHLPLFIFKFYIINSLYLIILCYESIFFISNHNLIFHSHLFL